MIRQKLAGFSRRARAWIRRRRREVLAGAAFALVVGWIWADRYPRLRVINTGPEPRWLWVDGSPRVRLPPTTTEAAGAGVEVRLSPGFHHLVTRTEGGGLVEDRETNLPAHSHYLYAPGDTDQCFWVEHTAYGQARPELAPRRLLDPEQHLWPLPGEVDAWFYPTPPASSDHRSSGGTRTAVRQARCGFDPWH